MPPFEPGTLTSLLFELGVDRKCMGNIKSLIKSCTSREELDDVHSHRRTAFMVAARLSKGADPFPEILDLIWSKYKALGCDLQDVLSTKMNYGPGNWSVFMNACKCGDKEMILKKVYGYYKEAFHNMSKKQLAEMLQDHIDWAHVDSEVKMYLANDILDLEKWDVVSNYATTKRRRRQCTNNATKKKARSSHGPKNGNEAAIVSPAKASATASSLTAKTTAQSSNKRLATDETSTKTKKKARRSACSDDTFVEDDRGGKPSGKPTGAGARKKAGEVAKDDHQPSEVPSAGAHMESDAPSLQDSGSEDMTSNDSNDASRGSNNEKQPKREPGEDDIIVLESDDEQGEQGMNASVEDVAPDNPTSEQAPVAPTVESLTDGVPLSTREMIMSVEEFLGLQDDPTLNLPAKVERMELALGTQTTGNLKERLEYLWIDLFGFP